MSGKRKLKQCTITTHLLRWQKSRTLTTPKAGKNVERQKLPFIAGGNAKWYATLECSWAVPYEAKHTPAIQSKSCSLIFTQMSGKIISTKSCTWMFIAAVFVIAKTWKQRRCPSVGEWINKLWYIHTVEYYSTLKSYQAIKRHGGTLNAYC